jgi:hypothetical protein
MVASSARLRREAGWVRSASEGGRHGGCRVAAPVLLCRGVLVGIEGAQAAAAPADEKVGPAYFLVFILSQLELVCDLEEGTEQGSAVIVGQLDEAGLLHEATQLDEVTRALAPLTYPVPGVRAGTGRVQPMPLCRQTSEPSHRGL